MKNTIRKIGQIALTILILPIIILFFLVCLVYLPIDWLRYLHSFYYKNTKEKYHLFGGLSSYFRLYNTIAQNQLPIAFYRDTDIEINSYGYFVYKNVMIINDYTFAYDEESKTVLFSQDDDWVTFEEKIAIEELKQCNKLLGEDVCNCVVFLIDNKEIPEDVRLEFGQYRFKKTKQKDCLSALRDIISDVDMVI